MVYEIFKIASLLFFIFIFGEYSKVIAGFLWAVFTLILRIPIIGKIYHFLLFDRVKFSVLFKVVTWGISASGILIGVYVYYWFFNQSNGLIENTIILTSCIAVIVNFFYNTMYVNHILEDFSLVHSTGQKYVRKYIGNEAAEFMEDEKVKNTLLASHIIDIQVVQFFRYLVCIGLLYYSSSQLGFFSIKPSISTAPNLITCIKYAFAFIPIEKVNNIEVAFEGNVWDGLNIFLGIGVFLWTFIFFGVVVDRLSQHYNSSEQDNSIEKKINGLDEILGNVFHHFHTMLENLEKKVDDMKQKPKAKNVRNSSKSKKDSNSESQ